MIGCVLAVSAAVVTLAPSVRAGAAAAREKPEPAGEPEKTGTPEPPEGTAMPRTPRTPERTAMPQTLEGPGPEPAGTVSPAR